MKIHLESTKPKKQKKSMVEPKKEEHLILAPVTEPGQHLVIEEKIMEEEPKEEVAEAKEEEPIKAEEEAKPKRSKKRKA